MSGYFTSGPIGWAGRCLILRSDGRWRNSAFPTRSRQRAAAAGHKTMAGIAELMERCRANGSMRKAPMAFVAAIMNSLAEATMDFMVQDPNQRGQALQSRFRCPLEGPSLTFFWPNND